MDRKNDGHVLEQLQQAALLRRGAVIELRGISFRGQVEHNAHFVLKSLVEFRFRQYHASLLEWVCRKCASKEMAHCALRACNRMQASLPPAQAVGIASTTSATGYQCGPKLVS